jgi:ATP-dependent protease ClpP protease subunit
MKTFALAGMLAAGTVLAANAATIKYDRAVEGLNAISVTGKIEAGDAAQFQEIASTISGPTVVILRGPGGLVVDGLNIGLTIRQKGFATGVQDNAVCASVCGLIWLAGSPRFLSPSSKIGFHAASGEDGRESGQGNALVGAYIAQLGLSYDAVAYLTDASPGDMHWLTPDDAQRVGITYLLVRPTKSGPQPFIAQPQPQYQAPTAPVVTSAEQQAKSVVLAYNAYWSQSGTNVEELADYYADMVSFYGTMTSRDKMMDEKRKFAVRWPIRHYVINPGSLFVQCDSSGCTVTGVVNWDCTSQERGAHSVGSSNFALRLVNGLIVSENGSTLTGHRDTVESQQAPVTASYAQGRQARIEYEQWYAGLPDGNYKDGATFWATHRSDKPPLNCVGLPDWVAGCVAARVRLSPSDLRRTSDMNFRLGWNSL